MKDLDEIDYSALEQRPGGEDIEKFKQKYKIVDKALKRRRTYQLLSAVVAVVGTTVLIVAVNLLKLPEYAVAFFTICLFIAVLAPLLLGASLRVRVRTYDWSTRLWLFARANDLKYSLNGSLLLHDGSIFSDTLRSMGADGMSGKLVGADMRIGCYAPEIVSGQHPEMNDCIIAQVKLPRKVPHIVLDSVKNTTSASSEDTLGLGGLYENQVDSLEGGFDEYFTLYAPSGYGRDVRYIFTPDVMELLVNTAQQYDIELIDDTLHICVQGLYNSPTVGEGEASSLKNLKDILTVAAVLSNKIYDRTDFYVDEHAETSSKHAVAAAGKRLKTLKISDVYLILLLLGCSAITIIALMAFRQTEWYTILFPNG